MRDTYTHSSWNLAGLQNSQDDVIINLVMGSMFLVLPTFWLGAMTWAGVRGWGGGEWGAGGGANGGAG